MFYSYIDANNIINYYNEEYDFYIKANKILPLYFNKKIKPVFFTIPINSVKETSNDKDLLSYKTIYTQYPDLHGFSTPENSKQLKTKSVSFSYKIAKLIHLDVPEEYRKYSSVQSERKSIIIILMVGFLFKMDQKKKHLLDPWFG